MGQPVKVSDELLEEARIAGAEMQRSIAGQVEFWARIGRAVEQVSSRTQIHHLRQRAAIPLSELVKTVEKPEGRARLKKYLASKPYPRFIAHPTLADVFVRETADGTKTLGKFEQREFRPLAKRVRSAR